MILFKEARLYQTWISWIDEGIFEFLRKINFSGLNLTGRFIHVHFIWSPNCISVAKVEIYSEWHLVKFLDRDQVAAKRIVFPVKTGTIC